MYGNVRLDHLFGGDEILPHQWFSDWRAGATPERLLMAGILSEALQCLRGHADGAGSRSIAQLEQERAFAWITSSRDIYPRFSFIAVCEALSISPQCLRKELVRLYSEHEIAANKGVSKKSKLRLSHRGDRSRPAA